MVRTSNYEQKVLSILTRRFTERYSINHLAKIVGMTPKGMHKLLKRLELQGIVIPERLANAVFYKLNFASDFARKKAEIALFEEIEMPYARAQSKDLERLRPQVLAAVLFGSVLDKGEKAGDIDVMIVINRRGYGPFKKALEKLQSLKTKRIQPVIQTPTDFARNIQKSDPIIVDVLRKGKVLWGQDVIVDALKKRTMKNDSC